MFETLFRAGWIVRRLEWSVLVGFAYTLIAFLTSFLLFSQQQHLIGISTILFAVVLTLPTMNSLLEFEEVVEARAKESFARRHRAIITFFAYFFVGVFLAFFVLSLFFSNVLFTAHSYVGVRSAVMTVQRGLPPPPITFMQESLSIFRNNLFVMIVSFVLSLFYGAGAIFLLVLNASVFATTLVAVIRAKALTAFSFWGNYGFIACNLGIMFFHMIPEVFGYLLAAIAGGVLGKSLLAERFLSPAFFEVSKDAFKLFLLALVVLLLAAFIEVGVSKRLFQQDVCTTNIASVLILFGFLVVFVFLLDLLRKKYAQ